MKLSNISDWKIFGLDFALSNCALKQVCFVQLSYSPVCVYKKGCGFKVSNAKQKLCSESQTVIWEMDSENSKVLKHSVRRKSSLWDA